MYFSIMMAYFRQWLGRYPSQSVNMKMTNFLCYMDIVTTS